MDQGLLLKYREVGTYPTKKMFFDGIDSEVIKNSIPIDQSITYNRFSKIIHTLEAFTFVEDDYIDLKLYLNGTGNKSINLQRKLISLDDDKSYLIEKAQIVDSSEWINRSDVK